MTRAQQTAAVIAERLGVPVIVEPGWREMNIGNLSHLTVAEIREHMDEYFTAVTDPDEGFKSFGGESLSAFEERLGRSLSRLGERWGGKRLVIVTHGGVINWLLQSLVGGEQNPLKASTFFAVRNCTPTRIRVLEGPDGQSMWRIDYVGSLLPL
jgi:2,3-bisphosphoglycerate-dependent phosphoglycerate mutase